MNIGSMNPYFGNVGYSSVRSNAAQQPQANFDVGTCPSQAHNKASSSQSGDVSANPADTLPQMFQQLLSQMLTLFGGGAAPGSYQPPATANNTPEKAADAGAPPQAHSPQAPSKADKLETVLSNAFSNADQKKMVDDRELAQAEGAAHIYSSLTGEKSRLKALDATASGLYQIMSSPDASLEDKYDVLVSGYKDGDQQGLISQPEKDLLKTTNENLLDDYNLAKSDGKVSDEEKAILTQKLDVGAGKLWNALKTD
ncbi:MAG TPA: hypothetical protein V6C52_11270 [Coleofasciculaceae cyanobacterium]|jgi:hypothetical protein